MRLVKLLTALVVIHMGLGFTQMSVTYFGGGVADYGAAGWVSHTPIGTFVDLDSDQRMQSNQANPSNLKTIWDFANKLGDSINGLATFGYGFLQDIQPSDGVVYMVVMGFRILSALIWLGLGMTMIQLLFDSNLLTSPFGLAAIGVGAVAAALSAIGAAS